MPTDDTPPPPDLPRFVPTLTEVVQPDGAPEAPPPHAPDAPAQAAASPADLAPVAAAQSLATADELLARLGPGLDQLIAEAIGRVLHEQMLGFNARVQKTVAEVVREAVAKSLVHSPLAPGDVGENP